MAQTYFDMSSGDYSENFDDIANTTAWPNGFNGTSSTEWRGLPTDATGSIPSATRITTATNVTFATGSGGGVQRGVNNMYLLSTGSPDNTTSAAVELYLNFTNRNAGTMSFDVATVFNSMGNRSGSVRVYASPDGATFTEVTGTNLPYTATNNVAGSASISSIALPSALNGASTARLRFYYHNGVGVGTTGSRPKISIDNLVITSTPSGPVPTITIDGNNSATAAAFTTTYGTASAAQTFAIAGTNLTADITATAPTGFEVAKDAEPYGATATFTQSGGNASGTLSVRLKADAAVTGTYNSVNIALSTAGGTTRNVTTAAAGNSVTAKGLTITGLTGNNKPYDGNTTATFSGTAAYSGLENGESFSVAGTPSASFTTAGVGTAKPITVVGFEPPSSNYTVTQPAMTGDITAVPLSVTANPVTKTFNTTLTGGPGSTAFTSSGLVNSETIGTVTINYTDGDEAADPPAVYPNAVVPSAATGGSFDPGNYSITYVPANLTVSNTPVITVTGTLVAVDTVYGTASPTPGSFNASGSALSANLIINAPPGFEVSTSIGSGYASSIQITPSSGTVPTTIIYVRLAATTFVGAYNGDVTVSSDSATSQTIATAESDVSPKELTITGVSADDKVYDGGTAATLLGSPSLVGVETQDAGNVTVAGSPSATFVDANVADDIAVTVTGYTLSGSAAGNYTVAQPAGLVADITEATLTVTGAAVTTKPYDATTDAEITGTLNGIIGMDDVSLNGTGTFADPNVGTGIAVTSTSTLLGNAAGNYILTQPTGLTGNIIKATQTITFAALPVKTTADVPFALTATASSGLTVSYSSSVLAVATVAGDILTIAGEGVTQITATQAGDSNYEAASSVSRVQVVTPVGATGGVYLTENGTYSENFDSMGTGTPAYPNGWNGVKISGTSALAAGGFITTATAPQFQTNNGSATSGSVFNYGTTGNSDRALGSLGSGAATAAFTVSFVNYTGSTIEGANVQIGFTSEQWRQNTSVANEVWAFEWKLGGNANDLTGWNSASTFDINEILISAPGAATVDGNLPANRLVLAPTTFASLSGWETGQVLHLRWRDTDDTGSDAAMAIDDFSLALSGIVPPPPKFYWDLDGPTAGAGGEAPAGSWGTNTVWNSSLLGTAPAEAWVAGNDAIFAAGTDATGSYTVSLASSQQISGLAFEEGTVTLSGFDLEFVDPSPTVNVASGLVATIQSALQGAAGLTKQGPGTLIITAENPFTGNVTLGGGILSIGQDSSLGDVNNDIVLGGGTLAITSSLALPATRNISGSGAFAPALGTELSILSDLALAGITIAGEGTVAADGATNSLGVIGFTAAGTLEAVTATAGNISASHTSGTAAIVGDIDFGTFNRDVVVSHAAATLELAGNLTLGGGANNRMIKTGAGTLVLSGVNTGLNKVTLGLQAAVPTEGGRIIFDNKDALGITQMFFNYGALEASTPLVGPDAIQIGLSISGRASSPISLEGSAMEFASASGFFAGTGTSGPIVLKVNNHTIHSGDITGNNTTGVTSISGFAIGGHGRFTLSGNMAGLTMPLFLEDTVTVELNTSVLGDTSLTGTVADEHTLAANTTLAVGTMGTTTLVTVYAGINGAADSILHFDINGTARGNATDGYDALVFAKNNNGTDDVVGPITFAGKIDVDFGSGFVPDDGLSFDLLDWDPLVTPDFTGVDFSELPSLPAGMDWDTDDFATEGVIRIESTIPTLKFAVNANAVNESVGSVQVEVTILPAANLNLGQVVSVPFTVSGTATSGLDYTTSASPLRFGPGETTKFITINVKPDTLDQGMFGESDTETVILNLGNPTPAGLGGVVAGTAGERMFTLTITNDYRTANFSLVGTSLADQSRIVNTGTAVEFKTTPVGSAVLKLQWLKNGANLGAAISPVVSDTEQTYSIAAATLANGGRYSAKATNPLNPAGVLTPTSAELVVAEQLATFAAPRLTLGKTGSNFVITTNATGNGLQYRWYKNGVAILDSETALYSGMASKSLTIKGLAIASEGIYQCRVTSTIASLAGEFADGTAFQVRTAITPEVDTASFPMGRLPDATVGAVYNPANGYTLPIFNDTEGRKTPTTWTQKGLPAGLTISGAGVISGTPTVSISTDTTYNVTLTATNPAGSAVVQTTIMVRPLRPNAVGSFVAVAGRSGTFVAKTGSLNLGARLDFTTTLSGSVTGKLFIGTTSYSLPKVRMNSSNPLLPTITAIIKRKAPLSELTVSVTIDAATALVTGTLTDTTSTANFEGWRNVWNTKAVKLTKSATTMGSVDVQCATTLLLRTGMFVVGAGIPVGAKVDSITNATSFKLTIPATVTSAAPTVTLTADFGARQFTGLYNFALELPALPPTGVPLGNGFASFTVPTSGKFTLSGKTADGQAISTATFVGPTGQVIVYRQLYATTEKGSMVGTLDIDHGTAPDFSDNTLDGTVSWMRPADPSTKARTYNAGFDAFDLTAIGGRYVAPTAGALILGLTAPGNATLEFNEGGIASRNNPGPLPPAPNATVTVDALNKVAMVPGTTTTIVNSANVAKLGKFNGKFVLTDDNPRTIAPVTPLVVTRSVNYEGMIIWDGTKWIGYGFFLLPALPGDSPLTTTTTSPILSGQVVFEKQ